MYVWVKKLTSLKKSNAGRGAFTNLRVGPANAASHRTLAGHFDEAVDQTENYEQAKGAIEHSSARTNIND